MNGKLAFKKGSNIASASVVDLGTANGNSFHITGTTTITSFGSSAQAGEEFELIFDSTLTLTHNPVSLIIPGGLNISTSTGDTCRILCEGDGNWRITKYSKSNGSALVGSDVPSTRISIIAGENISAGNAVYISSTDGKAYNTDTSLASKSIFAGFASTTATTGNNVTIETSGKNSNQNGLIAGSPYFLNSTRTISFNGSSQTVYDSESASIINSSVYASFVTPDAPYSGAPNISLTKVTFGYHAYTAQNQASSYVTTGARILADSAGLPNNASVIATFSTFNALNVIQDTIATYDSTGTASLAWGTKYWIQIRCVQNGSMGGSFYMKIRINSTNVSGFNDYATGTTPVLDNTKELYQVQTYATYTSYFGGISTIPVTGFAIPVGRAISPTEILIDKTESRDVSVLTPTVGASPYTYQNVGERSVNVSITGGTVSLVQYSRDNVNFYQTATTTNCVLAIAPGDFAKITYSVAPVVKVFPL